MRGLDGHSGPPMGLAGRFASREQMHIEVLADKLLEILRLNAFWGSLENEISRRVCTFLRGVEAQKGCGVAVSEEK